VGCPAAMLIAAFTSALAAKPQAVHRNTAWLSREPRSTRPHAEHRWLVNAGLIFSTRPGALSCSRRTSKPHPEARMPRFSPALARTPRPGFSRAFSRAIAALARPRRFDPRVARASLRCSRRSLACSRAVRAGQCSSWPVDRAAETRFQKVPGVGAVVPQYRFLGGCGVEPVPGHANTLSDGADISGEVKRRFLPGLKARVSTPRFG
jgi:hypothetical protein